MWTNQNQLRGRTPMATHRVDIGGAGKGALTVFSQGNIDAPRVTFLTIHDVGANHHSMVDFANRKEMQDVNRQCMFHHICLPGQEDNAVTFVGDYPSMDEIADALEKVLEQLHIISFIGIGEGVGGNILLRYLTRRSANRCCTGVVLVHCVAAQASMWETMRVRMAIYRLHHTGINPQTIEYLAFHKFGHVTMAEVESRESSRQYLTDLRSGRLNAHNLAELLNSYYQRTDVMRPVHKNLKTPTMVVVGHKASYLDAVNATYEVIKSARTERLIVDDVGDVMTAAPAELARALVLFCQGFGLLTSLRTRGTIFARQREPDEPESEQMSSSLAYDDREDESDQQHPH